MQIFPVTPPLTGLWKNTNSGETENLGSFSKDKHERKGIIPIHDGNVEQTHKEQTAKGCQEKNYKVPCK